MAVDREYRIRIQTVGDPSGAQTATGALNEAASATRKGTAANEEAGKSLLELAEHSKGFHKLLHAITELSPAAGLGLIAAFNGPQAAIMGLIMLVHALKRGEEEAAKEAVEFAKEAGKGWGDIRGIIDGVVDAVMRSDQAHADWAKHAGENTKQITTALDGQISKLKAEAEAVKQVIEAMHNARLARLEADKDAGRITDEQYAARKAQIAGDKRMGSESVDATAAKAELAMVQAARDKAAKEAAAAKQTESEAFASSEDLRKKVNAGTLKAKAAADEEEAKKLKEKLLAAQAETGLANLPSTLRGLWDVVGMVGSLGLNTQMGQQMDARRLAKAEAEENRIAKELRERQNLARAESDKAAQAEAEQQKLDLAAARAKSEAEAKIAQANELKLRAQTLGDQVGAQEQGRKQSEAMRRLPELMPTPFGAAAVEDVRWASEIARKLSDTVDRYMREHTGTTAGQARGAVAAERAGVSSTDRQKLVDLGTRVAGHKVSLEQAVALFEPAARDIETYSREVLRIVNVMQNLARYLGPIRGRMDHLEAEVRALQANPTTRTLPGN